jgi:transposase-like protein
VGDLLAERAVTVDHVTIYRWVQRFTPEFVEAARPCRHAPGSQWFVHETYVKVAGKWACLYMAIDQHGQVIDVLLSRRRDLAATRRFLTRALRGGTVPAEVSTDRAPACLRVAQLLDRQRGSLQPCERLHGSRVWSSGAHLRVEGMPVQGSAQRAGRRPARGVTPGMSASIRNQSALRPARWHNRLVVLVPRRARCRGCGGAHVLLPAWCWSRRADAAGVIGGGAGGGRGRGRPPGGCAAAGTAGVDGAGLAAPVFGAGGGGAGTPLRPPPAGQPPGQELAARRLANHVLAQDDDAFPGGGTWVKPAGIGTFNLARLAAVGGSHCRFI